MIPTPYEHILKHHQLDGYVNAIFVLENEDENAHASLPFYADGYPGFVFQKTRNGSWLLPQNKQLTNLFAYGQTIHPIQIDIEGAYRLIVFQLYPFALRVLFGVNPKTLNDDCHDLSFHADVLKALQTEPDLERQISIMAGFVQTLVEQANHERERQIQLAIGLILSTKGKTTVRELTHKLHLTERTLQRLFLDFVGISPKQFAKIVQFQHSFSQISEEAFDTLTEIVYENGYADQSHFIRNFKKYTGLKPSAFKGL